jgi:hypothetical protein
MNPFSAVNTMLTDALGPLGPLIAVGILGLLLILIALPTMMKKQRDRFAELKDSQPNAGSRADKRALRRAEKGDKLERFAQYPRSRKSCPRPSCACFGRATAPRTPSACITPRNSFWGSRFLRLA